MATLPRDDNNVPAAGIVDNGEVVPMGGMGDDTTPIPRDDNGVPAVGVVNDAGKVVGLVGATSIPNAPTSIPRDDNGVPALGVVDPGTGKVRGATADDFGGNDPAPDVNVELTALMNSDGSVLAEYTQAELQNLTSLPTPDVPDGLVFDGWNWTLDELKAEPRAVTVGAMWRTKSGKTEFIFNVNPGTGMTVGLALYKVESTTAQLEVDWGDGSPLERTTGANPGRKVFSHTYANSGLYTVSVGEISFGITHRMYGTTSASGNVVDQNLNRNCVEIRCGDRCDGIEGQPFKGMQALETVRMHSGMSLINSATNVNSNNGIRNFTFPAGWDFPAMDNSTMFASCFNLEWISLPSSITLIPTSFCATAYNLTRAGIPSGVKTVGIIFNTCPKLKLTGEVLPVGVTAATGVTFQGCFYYGGIILPPRDFGTILSGNTNPEGVRSLTYPEGATAIQSQTTLTVDTRLERINIPSTAVVIGSSLLGYSQLLLKQITIPKNVTSVANSWINGQMPSLELLKVEPLVPPTAGSFTIIGTRNLRIEVPAESLAAYQAATGWIAYAGFMVGV